ncbi:hypothetical protein P0F65_18660 [Sphingomonas sp. I4]
MTFRELTLGAAAGVTAALAAASPAQAQERPTLGVELNSDENRRGLSWSGGGYRPPPTSMPAKGYSRRAAGSWRFATRTGMAARMWWVT